MRRGRHWRSAATLRIDRTLLPIDAIPRKEVLRYLGYRGQALSAELDARVDGMMARVLEVARPLAALRSYPVAREACCDAPPAVALEGTTLRLTGDDAARHLTGAREVVLFAVTLGAGVDLELRRLALVDAVGQVVFDAAASAAVERVADAAEALVRSYAADKGAFCGWRFSPGYGDLPLEVQPAFLQSLDATRRLGITLTPGNLMVPTKSVTAFVGIHDAPQEGLASSCELCSLADFCALRARGVTCRV